MQKKYFIKITMIVLCLNKGAYAVTGQQELSKEKSLISSKKVDGYQSAFINEFLEIKQTTPLLDLWTYAGIYKVNDNGWYIIHEKYRNFNSIILGEGWTKGSEVQQFDKSGFPFILFKVNSTKLKNNRSGSDLKYLATREDVKNFSNWVIGCAYIPPHTNKIPSSGISKIEHRGDGTMKLGLRDNMERFYKDTWHFIKRNSLITQQATYDILMRFQTPERIYKKTTDTHSLRVQRSNVEEKINNLKFQICAKEREIKCAKDLSEDHIYTYGGATSYTLKEKFVKAADEDIEQLNKEIIILKAQIKEKEKELESLLPEGVKKNEYLINEQKQKCINIKILLNSCSDSYNEIPYEKIEEVKEVIHTFCTTSFNGIPEENSDEGGLILVPSEDIHTSSNKASNIFKLVGITIANVKNKNSDNKSCSIIDLTTDHIRNWISNTIRKQEGIKNNIQEDAEITSPHESTQQYERYNKQPSSNYFESEKYHSDQKQKPIGWWDWAKEWWNWILGKGN